MGQAILTNMGLSALALIVCLFCLWLISLKMKDASIIDIFWGAGFAIVAIVCLALSAKTPFHWLLAGLPIIWGVRLSLYLAKRNLGHGEDKRYVAMRQRSNMEEMAWRKRAFFTIYLGQGLLVMIVAAPIWVGIATGASAKIGVLAIVGALIWLVGFLFEAIGDAQLAKFIKTNKGYDGLIEQKPVMDKGLWTYTRHPNYFGNACMWWGTWVIALSAPWGWATIIGPIIMNLLLVRVSGKDLLERNMKKRETYRKYAERTSGFFPWPPKG